MSTPVRVTMRRVAPRMPRNWRLLLPGAAFAAFLAAGILKNASVFEAIPVDLTLLLAVVLTAMVARRWLAARLAIPTGMWVVGALFGSFALGALSVSLSEYGREKVGFMLTLTLLAAAAPLYLFRSRRQVRTLFIAMAVTGLVVALWAVLSPELTEGGRATAFGANPIATGRMAGVALLLATTALVWRAVPWPLGVTVAAIGGAGMVVSGSRAPMAAAVFAGLIMLVVSVRIDRSAWRVALVATSLLVAVVLGLSAATDSAAGRFDGFVSGDVGTSITPRALFLRVSWSAILDAPEGIGWGAYEAIHPEDNNERTHPHNLVVEILLEAGWLSGLLFVLVITGAVYLVLRLPASPERAALLTMMAYFGMESMFTGEINSSRPLFAMLGVGLVLAGLSRAQRLRLGWQDELPVPGSGARVATDPARSER